ncbi:MULTISPECIES: ABC transporter permease/substrate binding protein [Streptomycetaceae]|uniref:Putative glycine betaine ABC transporter substrate-binding and permease component n=1 Tax=Streptantibioticus cattleyicolor (strain ATCC 35852 / DSM 46488 / JCM 4925 / NBRC 14057 / NRRL 8057) TaxID=1003195 RepID=F8K2P5_STREN|nr:glycine betaine ABC transporter substrate-binding protein [Streptantibioticus cattleyicolor]AEW97555.1 putative glycine betaine ABC transporter substrate-binding and permease component [Streptantibioticus cattleyicolor NRRL 8057 = DSM 46488]MYS61987.1 ABC transporter permease subunit [Streptomyces sp. SID5468]CCB77880.1 putative glycine betaine ABC transporter substrate-binding and permease component [Streptantibioticus cattleyicolor NRRL 8057 = DSM 46488]
MPRLPLGDWVDSAVAFLQHHLAWLFDAVSTVVSAMYNGLDAVLSAPAPLLMAGILAVLALWLRGVTAAVLTFAGFALVDSVEQWGPAMQTLSLVLVATVITVVLAVPLGIWAARRSGVSAVLRPVLDFMQTMPAFVYLIPGIFFFGVGTVPGIIATIVFAMPPGVRMTELGIRQVDGELVEAAEAFGTTSRNTLLRVQLPLALPTILAGINQVIMLALSMVVIAGMVGGGGLGASVFTAISQVNVGLGFEGGIAVVILAMYLDRMTGALGSQVSPLGRRALAKAAATAGRGARIFRYRPHTAVAVVGVVALALVAGGMHLADRPGGTQAAAGSDVGKGRTIHLGYISWDEGVATSFLWKEILERRGYHVDAATYDVGALYTGMADGRVDFETDSWLPTTHAQYWQRYGKDLADLGSWYGPTSLEVSVPSYVKDVHSLADLKGRASQFGGRIIGIEPGAGEMNLLKSKVLPAYGLDKEYQLTTGSTASMLAQLARSYAKHEPVAVVLWSPHWAYSKYQLTKLADPKGAFGTGDRLHTLAAKGFPAKEPVVAGWLKKFHLGEADLSSLEAAVQDAGQGHEQQGVRTWLDKHPGLVDELAPVPGAAPAHGKDAGEAVSLGYFPWDESVATTYLWKDVLQARGYRPRVQQYDVGAMFTAMAGGQIDMETDGWLPNAQKQYWDRYHDDLTDLGAWYDRTSLEISVPSYVKDVHSLADLKGRASQFGGRIIGIEPGTGEMNLLKSKVLPAYGLDKEYTVTEGSSPSMLAQLARSYAKHEPVAVVLWSPHWAYSKYQLTKLADPKGAFGDTNQIHALAHTGFERKFPELNGWLRHWHMSEAQLGGLEKQIQEAGPGHEEQAVKAWIDAHPGIVDEMAPVGATA